MLFLSNLGFSEKSQKVAILLRPGDTFPDVAHSPPTDFQVRLKLLLTMASSDLYEMSFEFTHSGGYLP